MSSGPAIIIKKEGFRVDPKRPESNPDYRAALDAGRRMAPVMTFDSEHERKEYEQRVKANPNNVYGLPAFYPPLKIRSAMNDIKQVYTDEEKMFRERMRQRSIRNMVLYCEYCRKLTEHAINPVQCFCKKCGSSSKFRSIMS